MSNFQMWSMIVGFALPPVLSFVMQSKWSQQLQSAVAFLACLIAGAGTAYFQGTLNFERFAEAALVILVTTISTYKGFWKPIGVAPTIEENTNISGDAGDTRR